VGVGGGEMGVDFGVFFGGVADEDELALGEVSQDLVDDFQFHFFGRREHFQGVGAEPFEGSKVEGSWWESYGLEEIGQGLIEGPGASGDVVEDGAFVGPTAVEIGHSGDGFVVVEEGIGDRGLAVADVGDFDGVVDIGDDGESGGGDEEYLACEGSGVVWIGDDLIGQPGLASLDWLQGDVQLTVGDGDDLIEMAVVAGFSGGVNLTGEVDGYFSIFGIIDEEWAGTFSEVGGLGAVLGQAEEFLEEAESDGSFDGVGLGFVDPAVDADLPLLFVGVV